MKKIAFLFLTIENPNFPDIWDNYFKGHSGKYSIYIHPKYPEKVSWREEDIVKKLVPTGWGFITRAYIELLKVAYKDKDNYKFITISESCVPVKPFLELYEECINTKKSFIKTMKISNYDQNERINKQIEKVKETNIIQPKHFFKHYARFCLNREHTKKLLSLEKDKKLDFFHTMHVGDEFFLSVLYPLENYTDFAITFDDWDFVKNEIKIINKTLQQLYFLQEKSNKNMEKEITELKNLKNDIAKNPKTIINVEDDLQQILSTNSFFYRKFSPKSDIRNYIEKILKPHK